MPKMPPTLRSPRARSKRERNRDYDARQRYLNTNRRLYHTARWRALRHDQLSAEPYCAICSRLFGLTVPATVANHLDPRDRDSDFFGGRLESLCARCHGTVTAAEKSETVPFAGQLDKHGQLIIAGHKFYSERDNIYRKKIKPGGG